MKHRLSLQIHLAVVGVLLVFGILASIAWMMLHPSDEDRRLLEGVGAVLADLLPAADRPQAELQNAAEKLAQRLPVEVSIYGPGEQLLASIGEPLPAPPPRRRKSGWLHRAAGGPTLSIELPDGRLVVARLVHSFHTAGWVSILAVLVAAIAIGAYPVVRRITGRLERLQRRVDALGAGDLSSRVDVEGADEVADLARSFNRAADRIQRLVEAERTMLASASHELRSPLARIRVAVELLAGDERPELRQRVSADIAELDDLIGEILLASRLDTIDGLDCSEEIDLLALLAEEGARAGAQVSGAPVSIEGDPRMLRRLVRNLLDNARRYGGATPIDASVVPVDDGGARLRIADRGAGVPEAERDRIFEPFYRLATGPVSALIPSTATEKGSERRTTATSPPPTGVGLGLSLVRRIARQHGGEVRYVAREGGGSCFEVEFRRRSTTC